MNVEINKPVVQVNSVEVEAYCTCHDPACRGCGHCVDNIDLACARRPTREDAIAWLEAAGRA